jgi:hypothetical protein
MMPAFAALMDVSIEVWKLVKLKLVAEVNNLHLATFDFALTCDVDLLLKWNVRARISPVLSVGLRLEPWI